MAARRIYLSSTFVDLKDFREKVLERLRRAQSVVVAMEDYAAFDERPADKCLADVASCDIYIGVLGRRYGYVPVDDNPEQLSITEMEYRRAGNPGPGKPPLKRLMFQLDPVAGWPDEHSDAKTGENEAGGRIDRFRADVSARHGIRTFREPEELAGLVLESLLAMLQPESAWRWPAIWDFGAYMAHKGKDFVGRDWLFRDIGDWLAKPAPRALLIRADFGVGKSAILSELIKRNPGGAVVGWHFCQHDTQDTLAPAAFVRSVASQLAAALPAYRTLVEAEPALQDKLDRAGDDPASAFEAAIVGPLGRIAPPGGTRLLLVDALDEALEVDAATAHRHGNLIRLLANKAGRLPDWLRLLVTSRNNPEVIRPLRTFGLTEIDAENIANQSDLRDYALLRCVREPLAGRLRDAGRSADEVADILRGKSLGKFLYTIRALDDLENGSIAPDDLAALPPGMDSFYLDAFERRFARAGRDYAEVRDLLGVLALAKEPLPAATLAEILDQPASALQAVRKLLPDFIRLRGDLWAFDHFSLAEWLTGFDDDGFARAGDYAIDVEASKARFHAWTLRRIGDATVHESAYLVRHLAAHLTDDDERQRVFARLMLTNYEWIAERLRLRGVEALIADCKHLGDLAEAPLLRALFRSSAHVLRRHPDQLPAQLLGRIRSLADPVSPLADLAAATKSWLDRRPPEPSGSTLLPTTGSLLVSPAQLARWEGHTGYISTLVVMADGRIATGSFDGTVRIWNTEGGDEPLVLEGHTGGVTSLLALADGRIASGSDDCTLRVWDIEGFRENLVLEGHALPVTALVSLANGRIASGSQDRTVVVWDTERGCQNLVLEGHTKSITVLVALADGRIVSGSDDRTVRIWDTESLRQTLVLEGHTMPVTALVSLANGRIASGSQDRTVRVWDTERGKQTRVLEGQATSIRMLVALADGRFAFVTHDEIVHIWNCDGPCDTRTLAGHTDRISTLVALADGRIASGSKDGTVRVWDPVTGHQTCIFEGHSGPISTLAALADGRIASGSGDGTVRIWDAKSDGEPRLSKGHLAGITTMLALDGRHIASGSDDGKVQIWDAQCGHRTRVSEGHSSRITSLVALADGRIASGSDDGTVRIWDPEGAHDICVLEGHTNRVTSLVGLCNGRIASASYDRTVRVWDCDTGSEIRVIEGHRDWIFAIVTLGDGHIASGSYDVTVRIWDVETGCEAHVLEGHRGFVTTLLALDVGRLASGAADGTVRIWDASNGRETRLFDGHTRLVNTLVAVDDSRIASSSEDGTVRIWSTEGSSEPCVLKGHTNVVSSLVALDGSRIASGSFDSTVRLWDTKSGRQLTMFVADGAITSLVACRPDLIAAGDATGAVHFLKLHP